MKKDNLVYPEPRPALWLVGLYILSRLCFFAAGVRFDLAPIDTSWQILDPALLRENLLESLFYMPGQPPLYNLLIGGVLKLSDEPMILAAVFRGIYSALAIASVLLLYSLIRKLTGSLWLAFGVALVFMLTPALALYESIPYYTLMILSLLGAIGWLFHLCMERFTFARAFALFLAMAALIYTRSMFQWQWFVVLGFFCALVLPGHRKALLAAAIVPLAIVFALYGKNLMVTGHFATSDWMGMSLSKLTTLAIDKDERQRMADSDLISELSLMDFPFNTPEAYADYFARVEPTGITVLDQKRKSTGHVNYNHLAYADVSEQALEDALAAVRVHPGVYMRSMGTAWLMFLRPASDYPFLHENRQAIEPYSRAFSLLLAGQPEYPDKPGFDLEMGQIGVMIAIGYTLSVLYGLFLLVKFAVRRELSATDATLIFLWLNIMYVSVIGNAFEVDENQRFRFSINPFIAATLAVMSYRFVRWNRRGERGPQPLNRD